MKITMQLNWIAVLSMVAIVCIQGANSNCAAFANKIYQLEEKIENIDPIHTVLTLLRGQIYYGRESLARSINSNTYSDLTGYYRCPNLRTVYLSGIVDHYPNPDVSYLVDGAVGLFEHELNFNAGRTLCTGRSLLTYFAAGSDPFDPDNEPVHVGAYANITCRVLRRP